MVAVVAAAAAAALAVVESLSVEHLPVAIPAAMVFLHLISFCLLMQVPNIVLIFVCFQLMGYYH